MTHRDPPGPRHIVHVTCPACGSEKAVIAATYYSKLLCFCPACEHAWDCDAPTDA